MKDTDTLEQEMGENINEYTIRIERTYHEITSALIESRSVATSKVIAVVVKIKVLTIFINGLITPIRNVIKARRVKMFEDTGYTALKEEQSYESYK